MEHIITKATRIGRKAAQWNKLAKIDHELQKRGELLQVIFASCEQKGLIRNSDIDDIIATAHEIVASGMEQIEAELDHSIKPE